MTQGKLPRTLRSLVRRAGARLADTSSGAIRIALGWDAVTDSMMGFCSVESNCVGPWMLTVTLPSFLASAWMPQPIVKLAKAGKSDVGIIAFGSSDPAVEEGRVILERDHGVATDYLRLRALPIGDETRKFIESHRVVYVVEQNRDAQCAQILRLELPKRATMIESVLHYDGFPIDAQSIVEQIAAAEQAKEKGKS